MAARSGRAGSTGEVSATGRKTKKAGRKNQSTGKTGAGMKADDEIASGAGNISEGSTEEDEGGADTSCLDDIEAREAAGPGLGNAETALLGLLAESDAHPYSIEKEVRFRDMRFWTELSMSSIYKLLRTMEQKGYVARKGEMAGGRARATYSLTAAGREALEASLLHILSVPEHVRFRVDIGTYNCDVLGAERTAGALGEYRKALLDRRGGYTALIAFMQGLGCGEHRLQLARRQIFIIDAEVAWLDSFVAGLRPEE